MRKDKPASDETEPTNKDDIHVGPALPEFEPFAEPDRTKVPSGAIPLPPEGLHDQLDNSSAAEEPEDKPEIATLDFYGDELPEWTHPLRFKFRWLGKPVEEITVRQLTVAELGKVYAGARRAERVPELFDFYAAMTGLPAPVLRALKAVDGGPVTDKCWDFLPPSVRPEPD